MRKINLIVIHCSATRSNQRFTVEMLKACHNARFHGKGIGYYQKKKIIKSSQTMSADNQSITGTTLQNYF